MTVKYLSPADYEARIQDRESNKAQAVKDARKEPKIISKTSQMWGWFDIYAVTPLGANAPLPTGWRYIPASDCWYYLAHETELKEVVEKAELILGVKK